MGMTTFDANPCVVKHDEVQQHPSARQTETLRMLAGNIGRVVERDAILEAV